MSRAGRQVSCSGGPMCLLSIPFSNANDSQVISSEMDGTRISRRVYNMDHNIHPTDHVVPKIHKPVPHTCAAGSRCESGCTNQLMGYFCTPETCPCGADCVNLFKESPLLVGDDGVYTKEPVYANQLIAQYAGVIVGADDIPALAKAYAEKGIPNAFFAPLDDKIYIDANEIGNAARLIPRACPDSALCTMLRKYREGWPIQCIYARNNIPPGTRLTVTCTDAFSRAQTPPDCPCARCSERREVGTAGASGSDVEAAAQLLDLGMHFSKKKKTKKRKKIPDIDETRKIAKDAMFSWMVDAVQSEYKEDFSDDVRFIRIFDSAYDVEKEYERDTRSKSMLIYVIVCAMIRDGLVR